MYTLLEDIARMYVQGAALPQLKAKEALVGLVNKWRGATCQNIYLPALLRTALRICSRRFWNAAGKPVLCQGRDPEAITVLALFQEDLFFTNVPQQVAIQQVQGPCAALDHMTRTSFSWRGLQGGEGMLEHGGNEAHTTRLNKREINWVLEESVVFLLPCAGSGGSKNLVCRHQSIYFFTPIYKKWHSLFLRDSFILIIPSKVDLMRHFLTRNHVFPL